MFRLPPRKTPPAAPHTRRAFTLIELLAVIAIIGVLAAIIIPTVGSVRNGARSSQCASNLRQLGVTFNLYAADNKGLYPAPRLIRESEMPAPYTKLNPPPWANRSLENWSVEISPYIARGTFKINGVETGGQSVGELKDTGVSMNIAHCPSYDLMFNTAQKLTAQSNYSTAGYGINWNLKIDGAKLANNKARFRGASIDNPGRTVLVGDSSDYYLESGSAWTPITDAAKPDGYNSGAPTRHGKNANYLFADGRVSALTPAEALAALNSKI